jgi:hypothetical protein
MKRLKIVTLQEGLSKFKIRMSRDRVTIDGVSIGSRIY